MSVTLDRGARRLESLLGAAAVGVYVNGTAVPWDEHTAITITRQATAGAATDTTSTAQVTLVGHPEVTRGDWVTVYLSSAAVTALGGTDAAHRYRFAGRVTDTTLTYTDGLPLTLQVIAAGVLPSAIGDRWGGDTLPEPPPATYTNVSVFDEKATRFNGTEGAKYRPPMPAGTTTGLQRPTGMPAYDVPLIGAHFTDTNPPTRDVLNALADSTAGGILTEHRDGSIWWKRAGTDSPTVVTLTALAAAELPGRTPTNDVTITYGGARRAVAVQHHRNLTLSPYARSATGYSTTNATLTVSEATTFYPAGVKADVVTEPDDITVTIGADRYDPDRDGATVGISFTLATSVDPSRVTVHRICSDATGTALSTVAITTTSTTTSGVKFITPATPGYVTFTPPTGTAFIRLRVTVADDFPNVPPTAHVAEAHIITGPATPAAALYIDGFDGDTAAPSTELHYEWTGGRDASASVLLTNEPGPLETVTATDPATIATHGLTPYTLTAFLSDSTAAAALAAAYLTPAGYQPPPLQVDALALIAAGSTSTAAAALGLELGHRIAAAALPAGVPDDLTDPTACYVAGLTETITPDAWRVTITPALIP